MGKRREELVLALVRELQLFDERLDATAGADLGGDLDSHQHDVGSIDAC